MSEIEILHDALYQIWVLSGADTDGIKDGEELARTVKPYPQIVIDDVAELWRDYCEGLTLAYKHGV